MFFVSEKITLCIQYHFVSCKYRIRDNETAIDRYVNQLLLFYLADVDYIHIQHISQSAYLTSYESFL